MYYYGHGSWVVLVLIGVSLLARMVASRRRRGAGRPAPGAAAVPWLPPSRPPSPPGAAPDMPGAPGVPGAAPGAPGAAPGTPGPAPGTPGWGVDRTGIAPGWLPDPSGRHTERYWSGSQWTEHVRSTGVPATDPPPA